MAEPRSCIFCQIARGEIPAKMVAHNKEFAAFRDVNPQAPVHILIIPKKHIVGLKEAEAKDAEILGYMQLVAAKLGTPAFTIGSEVFVALAGRYNSARALWSPAWVSRSSPAS